MRGDIEKVKDVLAGQLKVHSRIKHSPFSPAVTNYFLAFFLAAFLTDFFPVAAFFVAAFFVAVFFFGAEVGLDFLVLVTFFAAFFFAAFFLVDLVFGFEKALAQPSAYFSLVPTRRIVMIYSCRFSVKVGLVLIRVVDIKTLSRVAKSNGTTLKAFLKGTDSF